METVSCDLCGADDTETIFAGPCWQQPVPDGSVLLRCRQCGLMYLSLRPAPDEISAYYTPDYTPYRPAIEDERFWLMRYIRRGKLVKQRRLVEKVSGRRTGSILDVGCSTGLFLHEMAQGGWQTTGVEPIPSAAEYARTRFGLEVFQGLLADASFPPQSFDVVTFWDVLEHTFSPAADLARAAQLLKPDGLLALNVPNYNCPDRRLFGPHWVGYDPPRHLYVFTRATLTALLHKTGFQPARWLCFMSSYYSFIVSLETWLTNRTPRLAKPVSRAVNFPGVRYLFEPYFTLMNWLKLGGVIAVFARKQIDSPTPASPQGDGKKGYQHNLVNRQKPFLLEIRLEAESQDARQGYDALYEATSLSQIDSFYLWLMKKLRLPTQGRLLDVACGAGEVVRLAGQHGLQAVGLDLSEVVARSAAQRVKSHGWIGVSRGESIPFASDSFDFVTNIGSLEHFEDPAKGVREMGRALKPGGKAFILVPNTFSLLTNVWHAMRTGETSADDQPVQRYGARADWVSLLEANGLKVVQTLKYERPWPYRVSDWGYYLRRPKELMRLLVAPLVPLNLAFCFLFICEKKPGL